MSDSFGRTVPTTGIHGGNQNFVLAVIVGIIAAVIGAGIWMAVDVALNMRLGIVAIGIGALVGYAIRLAGHGTSLFFGVLGAVLTLLSCVSGEVLAVASHSASAQGSMFVFLEHADLVAMVTNIFQQMSPMGYLILGIGVYEGFKLSMRH